MSEKSGTKNFPMYFGKALLFDFGCNFSQHLQKCPAVELFLKSEMADA